MSSHIFLIKLIFIMIYIYILIYYNIYIHSFIYYNIYIYSFIIIVQVLVGVESAPLVRQALQREGVGHRVEEEDVLPKEGGKGKSRRKREGAAFIYIIFFSNNFFFIFE